MFFINRVLKYKSSPGHLKVGQSVPLTRPFHVVDRVFFCAVQFPLLLCLCECHVFIYSSVINNIVVAVVSVINPYPTVFPYGNGMVLHFYQQQESSTTKTVHKVINRGLKAYV